MNKQNFYIENILKQGSVNLYINQTFPKVLTKLPNINKAYIIQRDNDLSKVLELLNHSRKVVLVNGLGGIGKTTLAKILLEDYKTEYQHIAWIDVASDLKEAFTRRVFMQNLGIDINEVTKLTTDTNHLFEIVINRLRQIPGNNLLVIDNAEEDIHQEQMKDYISLSDNWNILVTSRQNIEGFETYELGVLPQNDAIALFKLHYKKAKNTSAFDEVIIKILEAIDYHTLAIEIIARTAHQQKWSLKHTIDELYKNGLDFSEKTNIKLNYSGKERVEDIFKFILAAFKVSHLNETAQWILKHFSILPSLPIHFENNEGENIQAFLNINQTTTLRDNFTDAITQLGHTGWLQWEAQNDRFQMHRVVQEVLRAQLQPQFEDCQTMIHFFNEQLDVKTGYNPILLKRWSVYVDAILRYIKANEAILVNMWTSLGFLTTDFSEYEKALKYQTEAKQLAEKLHDNYWIATVLSNTAIIHRQQDELITAQQQLTQALDLYQNEEDLIRVTWKANLGIVHRHLGNYEEAKNLLEEALQSDLEVHGDAHPRTSLRQSVLSNVYFNLGEYTKASKLAERALNTDLKTLGKEHPKIPIRQSNLANACLKLGQYGKAKTLLEQAVELTEDLLGEEHTELATFLNGLASAYNGLGQYDLAIDKLNKAIQIFTNSLGENNRKTIHVKNTLAQTYVRNHQINQALALAKDNIAIAETLQLEETEFYGLLLHTLGCCLMHGSTIEVMEQSKKSFQQAYKIFRTHLGDEHPMTKNTWEWIWKVEDRLDALRFPMMRRFDDFRGNLEK